MRREAWAQPTHPGLEEQVATGRCCARLQRDTRPNARTGLSDTMAEKAIRRMVARVGFDAMLKGEADVVAGWKSKLQVVSSKVVPAQAVAEAHRKLAEPGSARHNKPDRKEVHPIGTHDEDQ